MSEGTGHGAIESMAGGCERTFRNLVRERWGVVDFFSCLKAGRAKSGGRSGDCAGKPDLIRWVWSSPDRTHPCHPVSSLTSNPSRTPMGHHWLLFALMTVVSWGVYGILLHKGQVLMGDPVNGRYKAFLLVGVAYFVVAILGPLFILKTSGATWKFTAGGINWSFIAGVAGAIGAFTTLLALGAAFKGKVANPPAVVMSIVFAGAPVVNALVSIWLDRLAGKSYHLPFPFVAGIVMAAAGGFMVVKFKPSAPPDKAAAPAAVAPVTSGLGGGLIRPTTELAAVAVAAGYTDVSTRSYPVT